MIKQQLEKINKKIQKNCQQHHRHADEVTLLAVSKRHSSARIREAYDCGQRHFGENYLNEALEKQQQLASLDIQWHYIGSIQSNKSRKIAEHFTWVHTVDSIKIATRLANQRPDDLPPLNICLQINIDAEDSKSGLPADKNHLLDVVKTISLLPNIHLRGLMCIPAPKTDIAEERATFTQMQQLLQFINNHVDNVVLDTLSMGMSNDLDAAIECGATIVRVGTAIFGVRD